MSVDVIGESVGPRYRILELIGHGGLGTVYKAVDTRFQRLVALKVLHHTPDDESKQRFLQEARALATLNHRNIVRIYDVGEAADCVYLVFQYVEGRTLRQVMVDAQRLDLDYAIEVMFQVGSALGYAHRRGVIHRDIKPENIMISASGRVLLLDFGLAIVPGRPTISPSGTIFGTPAYMSPEQLLGKPVDARSDIFSLGHVFYELLTGCRPFSGESPSDLILNIIKKVPASPRSIEPSVPVSIDEIAMRLLAKQPDQRFQTADQFLTALSEARRLPPHGAVPTIDQNGGNGELDGYGGATHAGSTLRSPDLAPMFSIAAPGSAPAAARRPRSGRLIGVSAALVLVSLAMVLFSFRKSVKFSPAQAPGGFTAAPLSALAASGLFALASCILIYSFLSYFRLLKSRRMESLDAPPRLEGNRIVSDVALPPVAVSPPRLDRRGGVEDWDTATAEIQPFGAQTAAVPEIMKIARDMFSTFESLSQNQARVDIPIEVKQRLEEFDAIWNQLVNSARHD